MKKHIPILSAIVLLWGLLCNLAATLYVMNLASIPDESPEQALERRLHDGEALAAYHAMVIMGTLIAVDNEHRSLQENIARTVDVMDTFDPDGHWRATMGRLKNAHPAMVFFTLNPTNSFHTDHHEDKKH